MTYLQKERQLEGIAIHSFSKHGKHKRRNIVVIGEQYDWVWDEDDLVEAKRMYDLGIPIDMIAGNFGRPIVEVAIMIMVRAEEGHIKPRETGARGADHGNS